MNVKRKTNFTAVRDACTVTGRDEYMYRATPTVYVEIYKQKKRSVFSNLLLCVIIFIALTRVVYVSRFRNMTLFPVREHSEHRCSLVFVVHCGIFQGTNVQVHWKYFTIETALKMV